MGDEPKKRTSPAIEFLMVKFTPAEYQKHAKDLACTSQAMQDLNDQKKARETEFKMQMTQYELSMKRLTRHLTAGGEMRDVMCQWTMEDPAPGEKTLRRLDTGETLRTLPMDNFDLQDELPIDRNPESSDVLVLEPPPSSGPVNGAAAN